METRVYWRFALPEEVQKRTIRVGDRAVAASISLNPLEVMDRVVTAFGMADMRGERPGGTGADVLMRADNEAAVTWVDRVSSGGGRKQARVGALMRMMVVVSGTARTGGR